MTWLFVKNGLNYFKSKQKFKNRKMKAKEVLNLLKISRPTLCKYVKKGIIKVKKMPNGLYDYDKRDVYRLLSKNKYRKNVIYVRVSTNKQKKDLENQIQILKDFCFRNGIPIDAIYKDIGSALNFERKEFQRLLNDILNYEIDRIFITYSDRLSRIGFDMFKNLFAKFGTEIIVLSKVEDEKLIEKEIFEEIISLIHCFAMKLYSKRKREKLKLIAQDLKLEINNETNKSI